MFFAVQVYGFVPIDANAAGKLLDRIKRMTGGLTSFNNFFISAVEESGEVRNFFLSIFWVYPQLTSHLWLTAAAKPPAGTYARIKTIKFISFLIVDLFFDDYSQKATGMQVSQLHFIKEQMKEGKNLALWTAVTYEQLVAVYKRQVTCK